MLTDNIAFDMFILIGLPFILIITICLKVANNNERKKKAFNDEMMRRLPDIEYTEIISSSNSSRGNVTTFNFNGGVGFGSYGSPATTKFLLVYKSGFKEIVNITDGTPLFNEYVMRLKKE